MSLLTLFPGWTKVARSNMSNFLAHPTAANAAKLLRGDATWVQQPTNFIGTVAGGSVPATATSAGDWYYISSAGTSQSKTWAVGDMAIYNGSSGSWSQLTMAQMTALYAPLRNALAPVQGLVFDGTAGATVVNIPAFGTADFTVSAWVMPHAIGTDLGIVGGATNAFALYITASGTVIAQKRNVAAAYTSSATLAALTPRHLVYRRASGVGYLYIDGALEGSAADVSDYSVAITVIGQIQSGTLPFNGRLRVAAWNRALSATEVVALHQGAAPAAADYAKNIAGTDIGVPAASDLANAAARFVTAGARPGEKFRFTPSWSGGGSASLHISYGGTNLSLTGGAQSYTSGQTYEITLPATGWSAGAFYILNNSGGTLTGFAFNFVSLGLVLAPDTNAPGNGYQWKDMSGLKADILVPATGALWALPDSRPNSFRQTFTWAGTHESKSMGDGANMPPNAVVTMLTTKASAASSGSGLIVGSSNSSGRWVALNTYTTAKKIHTLANQLPAGSAAADLNFTFDPDTVNFTGTIEAEVHFTLSGASV